MSRKLIDIGVEGNDGTGDSIRESFRKSNENFQELYSVFGLGGQIAFTDLADTPDTLLGNAQKIPVINDTGTAILLKSIVAGDGVSVVQPTTGDNANNVVISALSTRVKDDPTPELDFALNASNQVIGNLRSPVNDLEFQLAVGQFNAAYAPLGQPLSIDTFAVNKGYVDAKFVNVSGDTMNGPLNVPGGASGSQVPRTSEVVTRGGTVANRTMTDPLFLSDHPGSLAGKGTPTGADDLQAATKFYVDNASYESLVNLYVSTSGSDTQTNTPFGREGRSWAYAFRSVNRAAQKAEELINSASRETGPYRQLIAIGQGAGFSKVTNITAGAADTGTTRIFFSNNNGSRVDQGTLPKPDILPGKLVVGRRSGAKGIVFQYYGSDGLTNSDFFDLQEVVGTFELGENLEFDQPVKRLNITIHVESGTYDEDLPIRLAQNVSLVGEELRRVIIRPADRPSRSPWVDIWFRRDLDFDGLEIAETEYGYHYLSDPSDRASEAKNNRDIDVFLCGDATILRQITCQGHGGFMMVLDPEGQILSKSPYFQQGSSFSGSLNKQRFAGGQYVDGFAGNIPLSVDAKLSDTELLVTGSERAPQTPCSFVVSGRTFRVDAFTDDGTGFLGARQLILKNKEFIKEEVIGYIDSELNPDFIFDRIKCAKDVGIIIDALAEDFLFDTNYRSVVVGKRHFSEAAIMVLGIVPEKEPTMAALEFLRGLVEKSLVANSVARLRALENLDTIIDIIDNGVAVAPEYNFVPTSLTTQEQNIAKSVLLANFNFLKAEYIAFIQANFIGFVFDEPSYQLVLEEILYAAIYDLFYEGNTAAIAAGKTFFDSNDGSLVVGQTAQISSGLNHLQTLMERVISSTAIVGTDLIQTVVPQVLGGSGTANESNKINQGIGIVRTIVTQGIVAVPQSAPVNNAPVSSTLIDSKATLLASRSLFQSEVLDFLDLTFNYNKDNSKRDTGLIVDAVAHDVYFGGNSKVVAEALAYFTQSSKEIIGKQLTVTLDAVDYIRALIAQIIQNQSVTPRYQSLIPQTIDTFINGSNSAGKVNALFDEFRLTLDNPADNPDARTLLVANKEFIKAEAINFLDFTYKFPITNTITAGNVIVTTSTENMRVNLPIEFSNVNKDAVLVGGLSGAVKYYVRSILGPTQFTVSRLPGDTPESVFTDTPTTATVATLSYSRKARGRDVGFIVANTSSDLLYRGTYNTIRIADTYYTQRVKSVIGEQLPEIIAALEIAKATADSVLAQSAPSINYQQLNNVPVDDRVSQITDTNLDGSADRDYFQDLMTLVIALIDNPSTSPQSIIPDARPLVFPKYKLLVSDPASPVAAGVTNALNISNGIGFVSTVEVSGKAEPIGPYLVTLSIPEQSVAPYALTRYTLSGNENPRYNITNLECVTSTTTTMTFKFAEDPGVFLGALTTITYIDDIDLLSPGNTSMCSNDFTQINDLGYGLIATNTGLIEAVSVFSYYCYTAYYANNGGQIRSLNGSNANGEYGLIAEGSDPLEVPDQVRLADNMIQVAQVYKAGIYSLNNLKNAVEIYVFNHDYAPYNVSEVEINHGAGIVAELNNASLSGGSGYADGNYANIPLTGGTGIGCSADMLVAGGVVTLVALRAGGVRYTVGNILSVDPANLGGSGSGFAIAVSAVTGDGIARYEVALSTDVSSTIPSEIIGATTPQASAEGGFAVTFNFTNPGFRPKADTFYIISGNQNTAYNTRVPAIASTDTSVTVVYPTNPGTFSIGSTSLLHGEGNIIRLALSTGGSNDTSTNGLATELDHEQRIIIRSNQNFKFREVDDTNPVRPSTALTFINDPNRAGDSAGVFRVLSYNSKDPLNRNLAADESILGFDTTYNFIKLIVNPNKTQLIDPQNPGKTFGFSAGDVAIAVARITEQNVRDRLNSSDMVFAWDGRLHLVTEYQDFGAVENFGIVRFVDIEEKTLLDFQSAPQGILTSVDPANNLDLLDAPTLRVGLAEGEDAEIVVKISTCRVTGHDFLDIGTGGYNSTNYPSKIYGAPKTPNQDREVEERTRGRVFFVTTDQNGIFRVGRFFTVDQGTGRVTFSASIALSNLDGIGFKRGVAISEFSNDEKFTDGATDSVPTENAVQGYIDLRLGIFRSNSEAVGDVDRIGPGFMDRAGIQSAIADLNMGGNKLLNLAAPAANTDAANKAYVDIKTIFENLTGVSVAGRQNLDFLMYDGANWIDVNNNTSNITNTATSTGGGSDLAITRSGNIITFKLIGGQGANNPITNYHINDNAAIAQSKLTLNAAGTRASPAGIVQADRGLASFNNSQFTVTDGWVELQTSTSASTGVTLNKIQRIATGTLLGNRSGGAASPNEITVGQVVTDGDGIKNAQFTTTLLGDVPVTGVMTYVGDAPARNYGVFGVTKTGEASRIVRTDAQGRITAQGLILSGFTTLAVNTATNTLSMTTPGGVTVFDAVGNTVPATTVNIRGNTTLTGTLSTTGSISTSGASSSISSSSSISAATSVSSSTGTFSTSVTSPFLRAGTSSSSAGLVEGNWNLTSGSRFIATYADLAEYYQGDDNYEVGTVLIFGGDQEVTTTVSHMDRRVAGVVSEEAAYIMNSDCPGIKVCVALQGRVPVKVLGYVKKGDTLVTAAKAGYAIANNDPRAGTIIGKALSNKLTAGDGVVEVAVGRC